MQFSGNFKGKTPILSKFWAQAPPLRSKLRWAPLTKILDPPQIRSTAVQSDNRAAWTTNQNSASRPPVEWKLHKTLVKKYQKLLYFEKVSAVSVLLALEGSRGKMIASTSSGVEVVSIVFPARKADMQFKRRNLYLCWSCLCWWMFLWHYPSNKNTACGCWLGYGRTKMRLEI